MKLTTLWIRSKGDGYFAHGVYRRLSLAGLADLYDQAVTNCAKETFRMSSEVRSKRLRTRFDQVVWPPSIAPD